MFGQYDGAGVFVLPDSHTMAAVSLAATSLGAFTRFETHKLIESQRSDRDRRAGERGSPINRRVPHKTRRTLLGRDVPRLVPIPIGPAHHGLRAFGQLARSVGGEAAEGNRGSGPARGRQSVPGARAAHRGDLRAPAGPGAGVACRAFFACTRFRRAAAWAVARP